MSSEIELRLNAISVQYPAIARTAQRLVTDGATLDATSGALLISRRPAIAPEAYAAVLFPPISAGQIVAYERVQSEARGKPFEVSPSYRSLLTMVNGLDLYQLVLYGIPGSMLQSPPLLNRAIRQPLDLATANITWSREYRASNGQFHFGGAPYSRDENVGYFMNPDCSIEARLRGGELFASWGSMSNFLDTEIDRAEKLYPAYEAEMAELRKSLESQSRSKGKRGK